MMEARRAFSSLPSSLAAPWTLELYYGTVGSPDAKLKDTNMDPATQAAAKKRKSASPAAAKPAKVPKTTTPNAAKTAKTPKAPSARPLTPVPTTSFTEFTLPNPILAGTSGTAIERPIASPFACFLDEVGPMLHSAMSEAADFKEGDVASKAMDLWSGLSEEDKKEYTVTFDESRAAYLAKFNNNPLNRYELNVLNHPDSATTFTARTKYGLPLKPAIKNAYVCFASTFTAGVTEQLKSVGGSNFKRSDVTDKLKEMWGLMEEEDKTAFLDEWGDDMARHQNEFDENPANKESLAKWNELHPKPVKAPHRQAFELPSEWKLEEKPRTPPTNEKVSPPNAPRANGARHEETARDDRTNGPALVHTGSKLPAESTPPDRHWRFLKPVFQRHLCSHMCVALNRRHLCSHRHPPCVWMFG